MDMDSQGEQSMQEVFLQKLKKVILHNLSNEDFTVSDLVKELHISRTQIHRKLKKINGKSITQFIREIRLEEALKLLEGRVGTISEIAYKVGFRSPAYFTKCFHKYFGITPGEVTSKGILKKEISSKQTSQPVKILIWQTTLILSLTIVIVWMTIYLFNNKRSAYNIPNTKKSIAILPFINSTGDSSYNYLEYGISNLLINTLSSSEKLTIIDNQIIYEVIQNDANNRIASFSPDIGKEIATKVKVESYIYGNFLMGGSTFRITLKLIDTKSSKVIETDFVEGKIDSIFFMVDFLSNRIKNYLEIATIGERTDKETRDYVTTNSPEAYRFYTQGMEAFWKGHGIDAENLFYEALKIDSTFTYAYFFLSLSYSRTGAVVSAKKMLKKANEGMDRLPELLQLRLEAFKSLYLEKNPYEAINYFKKAAEIDPTSRLNWYWLANNYFRVQNYEDALRSYEHILKLNKQLGPWKYHDFFLGLGLVYRHQEKYNKAQKIYKEALQYFPESWRIREKQAICALLQNDTSSANNYISQYKSTLPSKKWFPEPLVMARVGRIYLYAGQFEKAEDLFRLALEMRLNQGFEIDTIQFGNDLHWFYNLLGTVLVDNDLNVEEGMGYLQKATDLYKERWGSSQSSHPLILSSLGYGYYKQGKYKEGLHYLKKAEEESTEYDHTLDKRIKEVENTLIQQSK